MDIQSLTPMPPYFLIKIGKEEQQEKKEKIGNLYFPTEFAYMTREVQFGEIISIGESGDASVKSAKDVMHMASIGDYLLVHHFISGKKDGKGNCFYFIGEDKDFNYYAVNGFEVDGEKCLAYALAQGTTIIPTPDYVFLEIEKEEEGFVQVGDIHLYRTKKKGRLELREVMKANMARCTQLARNIADNQREFERSNKEVMKYADDEIKRLTAENKQISSDLNKRKYAPYKLAAINPDYNDYIAETFGRKLEIGENIMMLTMACETVIDFSGTEFIVAQTSYIGCPEYFITDALKNLNHADTNNKAGQLAH